ncbi:hypothetical protein PUN28_001985 [Cardiocondyla obscurior]|uniref:Uncharacterized protein n=1 Tax=Cardiocondyla obscurior TaxID=286306 RepID=A0AAW2GS94_9HYME
MHKTRILADLSTCPMAKLVENILLTLSFFMITIRSNASRVLCTFVSTSCCLSKFSSTAGGTARTVLRL